MDKESNEGRESVKGEYDREILMVEGFFWEEDHHSTGVLGGGFSWICIGVEFCSWEGLVQGAPVCWRFWARGPGYPYGILELGSCPSWQGGKLVWAEFVCGFKLVKTRGSSRKVNKTSGRLASD
jgi:hypothetical protein